MRSSVIITSEGRLSTKLQRQKDIKFETQDTCPESYKSNTIKEELCLEYIHSFIEQFQDIHKTRKIPYMIADNEMGVKKFVCTTLRPTLIPIPELYDMYECASFIAGYVVYEPLDPPSEPPKHLFSPSQTLDTHTGDAFDMANLLTSFLIGSGYDAYMVCGYAPSFITLKDQSLSKCTMIHEGNEGKSRSEQQAHVAAGAATAAQTTSSSYIAPDNSVKNSQFLADQAEAKRVAALDTFQLWIPDTDLDEAQMIENMRQKEIGEGKHKRMHAWVLVRSGKREVKEHIFIEPTTGRIYTIAASPYIAIESVWNSTNFWVNTAQFDEKVSQMQFDLKNDSLWDVLFLSSAGGSGEQKDNQDGQNDDGLIQEERVEPNDEAKAGALQSHGRYFDAPPTWAAPLAISRSKYLLKYPPHGKRSIPYYCAKADLFARRVHSQCMVMRITTYLDQACTIVKEIFEWFEGRPDRMYKRARYFLDNRRFVEFYQPGSFGEVKKWTEYPGKVVECDFYVNGRLDRLARREETIGQSVVEHFNGRADFLTCRTVQLTADRQVVGTRQFPLPSGSSHGNELFAVKMTQQYDKDESVGPTAEASGSVMRRSFSVVEGKAVIYYHFAKGKVTGDIKTYLHAKGPSIPTLSDQALAQEVGLDDSAEALAMAGTLERDCFNSIKASFQQNQKLRETRRDMEHKIEYERTVFETALENADASSANVNNVVEATSNADAVGTDYLSPFIRNTVGAASGEVLQLTKEDALEIRQACLDALKSRLVERANIIQTKLHEENAALGKTQEHFQRAQREGDFDTEKYEATCTAAMFRIQILEQRLASHEEAALRKFTDLDAKLSNDPRLKVLKS